MTSGVRTEGIRGIGADGFIRTVSNLTITGDLVVHGETRSTIGTGSAFWEVADANAAYWAYELPSGGSTNVPVLGIGIGLDGVDLGLFDGVTETTLAVLDADRDSYLVLDFSADDSPRIRSNQDITFSGNVVFSDNITVNGTTTTISSSTTVIDDPLFHLGNDNNADSVDLGIFAEYTDSGKKFSGLFRDASDSDKWKLFATTGNSHEEPTTTVNTTSGFTLATLAVNELEGTITTAAQTNITSVGALDGGSITSNFGSIDTGSSAITTTGLISGGSLDIDNVLINGTTIGHTDDTDLITIADGSATLAGILIIDGNRSVTPGDGSAIHLDTHTVTDSNTSGSGTAATFTQVNLEAPTLAATNNSVTTTDAATLYISGAPSAGTNQTITRGWAVWVDAGNVRYDGSIYAGTTEALNSSGLLTVANQSGITGVGTITSGTWEGTTLAVNQGGTGAASLNNLITLTTHTTGNYVATITGGTGIDSDAATSGEGTTHTLSIDLSEVGEVAIADGDYIAFMDATDSNATKKEALADIATLFAGTGLTAASSVIGVDAAQSGITSVGTLTGLTLDGDKSVTPGDGSMIHLDTSTITDSNTSGSGTAALYTHVRLEGPALAATNSSVTTTDATTLYISGPPTAGTNQTLTNAYSLIIDSGNSRFDGEVTVGVDDTGHDVKFFGATSGSYMLWDESTDDLKLAGAANIGINELSPLGRLHITDASAIAYLILEGANNSDSVYGDIYLSENLDNGISNSYGFHTRYLGSANTYQVASHVVNTITPHLQISRGTGATMINDTANGDNTYGLTINQGAADDHVLAFKNSDVAHPFTAGFEADTYGFIKKVVNASGGVNLSGATELGYFGINLRGYAGAAPNETHTASGLAIVSVDTFMTDGSTGTTAPTGDDNLFAVTALGSAAKFIVDATGDLFIDGSTTAFDSEDDISLLRAVQKAVAPDQVIAQEFDQFLTSNEDDLIRLGILGGRRQGVPDKDRGLVCLTKLTQLLTGGVVQLYGQVMDRDKRIEALENRMLALGG